MMGEPTATHTDRRAMAARILELEAKLATLDAERAGVLAWALVVGDNVLSATPRKTLAERWAEMHGADHVVPLCRHAEQSAGAGVTEAYEEALRQYANSINWMTHTDQDEENPRRVWIGSGDGRDIARAALSAALTRPTSEGREE